MDFSLTEEQQAIADLAKQILDDKATNERIREVETSDGPRFDRVLWEELSKAGLLGIAVPEDLGGAGLGFLEVAAILEQVGRAAAPVPVLETVVLGALPIAEFGSPEHKQALLPPISRGELVLTAGLVSDVPVEAVSEGDGFRLEGSLLCVPAAELADRVLVPARSADGGTVVALLDPRVEGVRMESLLTTSGQPESWVELSGARVASADLLGDPARGERIVEWIQQRATAGLCMLALGCCEAALEMTAEYTKTRKQFDQPIAMFQAVGHRAADAYIDTEAIRLTSWQAAWRIAAGLDAAKQVAVAKFWAAEGGNRVVHAAQHLHGGIGVDREYPLHRHFLYVRQLGLSLGSATNQLCSLGRLLADEPAA